MPAMATIRHHARIDASPDEVWAVLSDAGAIADWAPGMEPGSVQWDGKTRTIDMGGFTIAEEVVTSDAEMHRFQYKITEAPMPLGYHLTTVDLFEDGDGTLLVYSCEVEPDDAKALMDPVYGGLVAALKARAEG